MRLTKFRLHKRVTLLWLALSLAGAPALSQGLLDSPLCRQAHEELAKHLADNQPADASQTVFFQRLTETGTVLLSKMKSLGWGSMQHLTTDFTPQGDPRIPIRFLGAEITSKLGFKIYADPQDPSRTLMEVPGANLLGSSILRVNEVLKARGQEPIAYLPIKSSLLTSEEILDLSISGTGDALIQFPYSDSNRNAPHEISFHIGALAYPQKFFKRANQINRHTLLVATLLRAYAPEFGAEADTIRSIADQLITERSYELDSGLADIQGYLSGFRQHNPRLTYAGIWRHLESRPQTVAEIPLRIDYLTRSWTTPLKAVMARVYAMTEIKAIPLEWSLYSKFLYEEESANNLGTTFSLSKKSTERLKSLLKEYVEEHAQDDGKIKTVAPEKWLKEFLNGLDFRLAQISSALDEIHAP